MFSPVDDAASKTRVLMLHNRYQQPGGEDIAVEQEVQLLRERGHAVRLLVRENTAIRAVTAPSKARLFVETVWSTQSYRLVRDTIRDFQPHVVHVHNYLPLLSPSVYHAAWSEHVPVVQTLHNYRLICPGALLLRDGRVCNDCVGRSTWRGVVHACYRGSRLASLGVASMLELHRSIGTWRHVDAYIALSDFQRDTLAEGGLPRDRLHVKPNFVAWDHAQRTGGGEFALYAGRLSPEKGIRTLIEAWVRAGTAGVDGLPLKVVGGGPLAEELRQRVAATGAHVELLGHRARTEVAELLGRARYLVYPSELHEPSGITVVEAFAAGVPVLASAMGFLSRLVEHGVTGFHFAAGDPEALLEAARRLGSDMDGNIRMGNAARAAYLARYTPDLNYGQLLDIYAAARLRRGMTTRR